MLQLSIFQRALESYDMSSAAELGKAISQLRVRIDKTRQRIAAAATAGDEPVAPVEVSIFILQLG